MKRFLPLSVMAVALSGCYTLPKPDVKDVTPSRRQLEQNLNASAQSAVAPRVKSSSAVFLGSRKATEKDRESWLTSKRITIGEPSQPIPITQIIRMLKSQGINIASNNMALDSYQYGGFGLSNVDAETALRAIFGATGLDYQVDNDRQIVMITPMQTRTWTLNIGSRKTNFETGKQAAAASGSSSGSSGGGSSTTTSVANYTSQSGSTENKITVDGDFWKELKGEIKDRLTILVPKVESAGAGATGGGTTAALGGSSVNGLPPMPNQAAMPTPIGAGGGAAAATVTTMVKQEVGIFSVNPETGAVSIQAPSWLLDGVGKYLDDVQAMYNASLTFHTELVMVSHDDTESEGLDIASFTNFARNRYGAVLTNNVLGGVGLTFPSTGSSIPSVTLNGSLPAQAALGIISPLDGLQIFNGYLSQFGTTKVVQRPTLHTTSGVPAEFQRVSPRYFNVISQTAAAGSTGSASTSTQNNLQRVDLGTTLKILPRFDVKNGLIRATIDLKQAVETGTYQLDQYITSDGATTAVQVPIPKVTNLGYTGEALLHDGDLIILTGMADEQEDGRNSGITGAGAVSSLFGKRTQATQKATYFFAVRVKVSRNG